MKIILFLFTLYTACNQLNQQPMPVTESVTAAASDTIKKMVKSEEEWKKELSPMEFLVLRQKGTERAFSGDLWDHHEKGVYTCRGCQLPLFSSDTKFESGTGWPSFYQPISRESLADYADNTHGMSRTEVVCARCGGHLGHVFDDGPRPTGMRYCINSVSLDFQKR
ncbi:MAG TPA: peptide-methionine (R)-S-oxide reductase MsrB [Saprospiraceae bacterium]|nr:peptide-methionine (R)-S-oxide reductase MsrB [Saprospiraceae bacterium]HNT19999.1 peptide-methionine (R)-S-oxide reductase MsrB [Saprospiraceae bacterium]